MEISFRTSGTSEVVPGEYPGACETDTWIGSHCRGAIQVLVMYADKDTRGLISVFEMDRPDWTALRDAAEMAVGVWKTQLKGFDGIPKSPGTDTEILQRILFLEQHISSAVNFINWIGKADGREREPFNPFLL